MGYYWSKACQHTTCVPILSFCFFWLQKNRWPSIRRSFFKQLPEAFQKMDVKILNDKGEIKVNKQWKSWSLLACRVASYFEVMLQGKPAKEYSSTVFWQLRDLQPRVNNTTARAKLGEFLNRMDTVAPDIMILWCPCSQCGGSPMCVNKFRSMCICITSWICDSWPSIVHVRGRFHCATTQTDDGKWWEKLCFLACAVLAVGCRWIYLVISCVHCVFDSLKACPFAVCQGETSEM